MLRKRARSARSKAADLESFVSHRPPPYRPKPDILTTISQARTLRDFEIALRSFRFVMCSQFTYLWFPLVHVRLPIMVPFTCLEGRVFLCDCFACAIIAAVINLSSTVLCCCWPAGHPEVRRTGPLCTAIRSSSITKMRAGLAWSWAFGSRRLLAQEILSLRESESARGTSL